MSQFFPTKLSTKQCEDTGMAMTLILLLLGFFYEYTLFYKLAIPVLLLNMTYSRIFYPAAIIWLGGSKLIGTVVSKVLLTFIYLVLVVPVAVLRRAMGRDSLRLKTWKKDTRSVLVNRNHLYTSKDIIKPF